MNLVQLKHFIEIARCEHLGKAARRLRLSPSTLSYSIECLTRDLNKTLFEKRGKNIFLTADGRKLLEHAPSIFEKIEELRSTIGATPANEERYYTLAATHGLGSELLIPGLASVGSNIKNRYEVFSQRSSEVVWGVLENKIDLGVCYSPQSHPDIAEETLKKGKMEIYFAKGHPLAGKIKNILELNQFPSTLPLKFEGIEMCELHPMFEEFKINPDNILGYDSYDVAVATCRNTLAWTLLPDFIAARYSRSLASFTHPKGWVAPYSIKAIWNQKRKPDSFLKQVVDKMKS